jgi:hypothetical protein
MSPFTITSDALSLVLSTAKFSADRGAAADAADKLANGELADDDAEESVSCCAKQINKNRPKNLGNTASLSSCLPGAQDDLGSFPAAWGYIFQSLHTRLLGAQDDLRSFPAARSYIFSLYAPGCWKTIHGEKENIESGSWWVCIKC